MDPTDAQAQVPVKSEQEEILSELLREYRHQKLRAAEAENAAVWYAKRIADLLLAKES